MIVRVDDFPCGNERGEREFDAMEALLRFRDALAAPFCLGVVLGPPGTGYTTREEWQAICGMPDVTVAFHGWEHRLLTHETHGALREFRAIMPNCPIVIPPKNMLDQHVLDMLDTVEWQVVCTGPETARCGPLDFRSLTEVPSAFYGTAQRFNAERPEMAPLDCLTLHLTWERRGGKGYPGDAAFGEVRRLGAERGAEIVPWPQLLVAEDE